MTIQIKNLNKTYNNVLAVQNISFKINKGSIIGLLGPNGCGKTTTIGMMLGLIKPSSGSVFINGLNIENESEIKVIEEHNQLINDVSRHYPNFNKNIDNILLFLENPGTIKCLRNKDHLMNENVFDAIEDAGPILLFAIFCENIVINDPI